jgi:nucleotide-binding universal stress UspA family protein
MFNHLLVPMDGSALAECVLPHVLSLATALDAQVTLFHVLERPRDTGSLNPVDPLKWQIKKREAEAYLERLIFQFREVGVKTTAVLQEGSPAECIINYANASSADLIVLSTHGLSGLSKWNMSSVVQKIMQRANKSSLLVRAYQSPAPKTSLFRYQRLFIGLDCSARAEMVLPVAIRLANHYKAQLILGSVIQKPNIVSRFPLSDDDLQMIERLTERNRKEVTHYLEQLQAQLHQSGLEITTSLEIDKNQIATLHRMVTQAQADIVMLVAHGHSGEGRWPYGSVAGSFIEYGNTSLLIMQDLTEGERQASTAEIANLETQGH